MPKPTIADVAADAGVSYQTVSNVLRWPERVAPTTAQRVQDSIARLGYVPHRLASELRLRATRTIGYQVAAGTGGVSALLDEFLHALCDTAGERDHHVLLFSGRDDGDISAYRELLSSGAVGAFVVSGTDYGDPRVPGLLDAGVPFAAFGRSEGTSAHDWVDVDGAAGTATAVAHLVATGRERIAFLGWPEGSLSGDDRFTGYRDALREHGVTVEPALVHRGVGEPATSEQAFDRWDTADLMPDAAVAANDRLAVGLLRAARRAGVTVGAHGAMAVIGFDDEPIAALTDPALTTLRQPVHEVARTLVDRIVRRIAEPDAPSTGGLLGPELVVRDSA